ncbi:MAG: DUF4058 family protein [Chloroflexota bacterium]
MASPFPGMDPYLEGYLWPDVHQALAGEIRKRLVPQVAPKYAVRLAISTIQDESGDSEIGIMYPDVEVLKRPNSLEFDLSNSADESATLPGSVLTLTPPQTMPLIQFEFRQITLEVRDTASNALVTSIEILSPVNKREPGLSQYRTKQRRLRQAGVHLLEIDLLRRGTRPIERSLMGPDGLEAHYLITLLRSEATEVEAWPTTIQQPLPTVAVPLRSPDDDILLPLNEVLSTIYQEAAYGLTIDYDQKPPPPTFEPTATSWMQNLLL